jgi:hypothetical protein
MAAACWDAPESAALDVCPSAAVRGAVQKALQVRRRQTQREVWPAVQDWVVAGVSVDLVAVRLIAR